MTMTTNQKRKIQEYLSKLSGGKIDVKAALIDMDGTLFDSMPSHADAWMVMCRENGIPARRDEFFMYEGRTGASTIDILIRRAFGRAATEEEKVGLYRRKTEVFSSLPPVAVMPGARRMLREMMDLGIMRVLVTGSGQASLLSSLATVFPGAFREDRIVMSRDVIHGKPDPEPYLKGLALAGVAPEEAIVVENAPLGVEAGARAGIFTVGLTTGPIPEEALYESGAAVVFDSMESFARDFTAMVALLAAGATCPSQQSSIPEQTT